MNQLILKAGIFSYYPVSKFLFTFSLLLFYFGIDLPKEWPFLHLTLLEQVPYVNVCTDNVIIREILPAHVTLEIIDDHH